jgi:Zn-dependent protease
LDKLQTFALIAPVLLFSMVAHEYAHGYAAWRNGDPTAMQLGRLTWNPLKHIDPFLTIVMPIVTFYAAGFVFGGAKPVPVNPRNYRHYRRGDIVVSLAGIAVNLLLALVCTGLIIVLGILGSALPPMAPTVAILQAMMFVAVFVNLILAFFNLLPIPPLDGSHVFKHLLPPAWALRYERIGFLGLIILLLFLGKLRPLWWGPVSFFLESSMRVTRASFLPQALDLLRGMVPAT